MIARYIFGISTLIDDTGIYDRFATDDRLTIDNELTIDVEMGSRIVFER